MELIFTPPISKRYLKTSKFLDLESNRITSVEQFEFIQTPGTITYDDFFCNFLLPNKPCILSSVVTETWRSRREWVKQNGRPDIDYLKMHFGDAVVPVADCKAEKFGSHCKTDWKMHDYLEYWREYMTNGHPEQMPCLYLKDWHFTRDFPSYNAYTMPEYFTSDWLNEFWDSRPDVQDDYRFVYMGPKGTWTPFHADVFRSFSWSANICGRKKWIFIPPGEEEYYKDRFGQLVYDVNSDELKDSSLYPKYHQSKQVLQIIQDPGETIFVPSGWHHQVFNLEDTISINHNWMNGCNIDICWNFLKQNLRDVQGEISDCLGMDGWHEQCQLILKASSGIDFCEFYRFMLTIADHRLKLLNTHKDYSPCRSSPPDSPVSEECGTDHTESELKSAESELKSACVGSHNLQSDIVDVTPKPVPVTDGLENNQPNLHQNFTAAASHTLNKEVKVEQDASIFTDPKLSSKTDILKNSDQALQTASFKRLKICDDMNIIEIQEPSDSKNYANTSDADFVMPCDKISTVNEFQAHLRCNHAEFDLMRILNVLQDMVENKEFCCLDLESSGVEILPDKLIAKIQSVLQK